jgi:hypothetical protein
MLHDLTPPQRRLADYLIQLSERCWQGAGWIMNLEFVTWNALTSGPRPFGYDAITAEDIATLKHLANSANAWIMFDDQTRETAIQLAKWPAIYDQARRRNRELLDG